MSCACNRERLKDLDAVIRIAKIAIRLDGRERIIVKVGGEYYRILFPGEWDGVVVNKIIITKNGIARAI